MRGRLVDLSIGLNRKQRVTIELDSDFRGEFDKLRESDVSLEVKQYRQRRSLDANAYCWVLMDKLSVATGVPRVELYRSYIREIGGNSETVCVVNSAVDKLREGWHHNGLGWQTDTLPSKLDGCTNVVLYYGSSTYDTAQMSRLIEMVVQDCREQGIEVLPPYKLAALVEEWK